MREAREARRYLRTAEFGILATLSRRFPGYPFGSIAPFVLDHAAQPIILISRLAEHRKNIEGDHRVSLLVHDAAGDVQASARVTLIGDASKIAEPTGPRDRYLRYVPAASQMLGLGDFDFFRITPMAVRFIAGFGAIHWLSSSDFRPPASLEEIESEVLTHMNVHHARALRDYCRHYHDITARNAEMIGIDCDGFDVRADGMRLRFQFESPVANATQARTALASMADASR